MRPLPRALLLVVTLGPLAACGSPGITTTPRASAAPDPSVTVSTIIVQGTGDGADPTLPTTATTTAVPRTPTTATGGASGGSSGGSSDGTAPADGGSGEVPADERNPSGPAVPPGPSGDPVAEAYRNALTDKIQEDQLAERPAAACAADRWLGIVPVERFAASGVAPEQFVDYGVTAYAGLSLTRAEADAWFDALAPCGVDPLRPWLASLGDGPDIAPAQEACVRDKLTPETLRELFMMGVGLSDDPGPGLLAALTCLG